MAARTMWASRGRITVVAALALVYLGALRSLREVVLDESGGIETDQHDAACVGLTRFPAHRINTTDAVLESGVETKADYFESYLGSRNITMGRQMNVDSDLCLQAQRGAALLPAERLAQGGYRFVIFIGDSMAREAAWSLRRLVGSDVAGCQPWPSGLRDDVDTKEENPGFECRGGPSESGFSCPAGAMRSIRSLPESCCARPFVLYREDGLLNSLVYFMAALNANCKCRGIVYISSGVWVMDGGEDRIRSKYGSALGRQEYTFNVLSSLVSNNPRNHSFVWASPPDVDLDFMLLSPTKPGIERFNATMLELWHEMDLEATSRLKRISDRVFYSGQFEVSSAYRGLNCDGLHFTTAWERIGWGCLGMPVVTDVLTQLWLHRVLHPTDAPWDIC